MENEKYDHAYFLNLPMQIALNKTYLKMEKYKSEIANKYYTPTLEEIKIGLEYQFCSGLENPTEDEEDWTNFVFGESDPYDFDIDGWHQHLKDAIERKLIRVPYLSKEDIEECGWRFSKIEAGTTLHFFTFKATDLEYCMDFDPNFKGKIWLRIYDIAGDFEEMNFFSGSLNNKSELRILMKWLNIK